MKHTGVLLLAAIFCLVGCSGTANVVGKYKGKVELPKDNKDPASALGEGMMNALAQSLALEIKADKTFTMTMIFPIEGTWTLSGNKLTLTPKSMMRMTAPDNASKDDNKPMEFTVSGDGKTLTATGGKPEEGKLLFTRE